eukprot:CAMPEP_0198210138 /NCGR_PEP_ID=MMETSP1445-20131203/19675_1 /TAXON_ID=36898 /ORGANISM="Pyramimonas sp., Strain CCMP2087" /LENGTH=126 /DNA_ID=CAMNT_0043884123 /DNA_START=105 /DNA_END=485 /DNA_ORIENTATION=-
MASISIASNVFLVHGGAGRKTRRTPPSCRPSRLTVKADATAKDAESPRWSGFNPDLVDSAHSIRTWDVFRIVENNKLKRQIAMMREFGNTLKGNAAVQCTAAVALLEQASEVLSASCVGDECGFME